MTGGEVHIDRADDGVVVATADARVAVVVVAHEEVPRRGLGEAARCWTVSRCAFERSEQRDLVFARLIEQRLESDRSTRC